MNGEKQKARPKGVNLMYAENEIRIAMLWLARLRQRSKRYAGVGRSCSIPGGKSGFS